MLPLAVSAIATLATTLVTGDRVPEVDLGTPAPANPGQATYGLGKSSFAHVLSKVAPDPEVMQTLEDEGKLANTDPSMTALLQAASPQAITQLQASADQASAGQTSAGQTPAPKTTGAYGVAVVQQAIQNGAAQLYQSSRLGLNLDTKS